MKIKRGSVTPVDLTGQADGDYIRNDGGIYKPKTVFDTSANLINTPEVEIFSLIDFPTNKYTSGTASASVYQISRRFGLQTGTTAGSEVTAAHNGRAGWSRGVNYLNVDFRNKIVLKFRWTVFGAGNSTANSIKYFGLGGSVDSADVMQGSTSFFGIRAEQDAMYAVYCNNDASITQTALSFNFSGGDVIDMEILSNNGALTYYGNDTELLSVGSGGPNTSAGSSIKAYLTNGADEVQNFLFFHSIKMMVEQ